MKICKICNQEKNINDFYKYCNSCKICYNIKNKLNRKKSKLTKEEISEKLSKAVSKFWSENPDKHPWKKNTKFKSVPCINFKKILSEMGIQFIEEYTISDDRLFSVDIALPQHKISIEINGNQHYEKDGTLKEYYKNRHNFIESLGWKIYELHYSICFNDEVIKKTINNILDGCEIFDFDYDKYLYDKLNRSKEYKSDKKYKYEVKMDNCKCGELMRKGSKICRKCASFNSRKVERPPIDILLKEIKNMGYVKTGKKYGVSDNAIRKWVKSDGDRIQTCVFTEI